MPTVEVEVKGLKEAMAMFDPKQVKFATVKALTATAQIVKTGQIKEMKSTFKNPTPFTLNSLQMRPATKSNPVATVWVKEPPTLQNKQHYLVPQVHGGSREFKAFEAALFRIGVLPAGMKIVPGNAAQLDGYGNISRGQIVQILSYFKAFRESGFMANITDKRKARLAKGSKKKIGFAYFVGKPGNGKLPMGIYQRFHFAHGTAIKPILIFVKDASYRKRWQLFEKSQEIVNREFPGQFDKALSEALATAR